MLENEKGAIGVLGMGRREIEVSVEESTFEDERKRYGEHIEY